eukprot:m.310570 g.310570  ORF g.310570 m.310570 type:complete len:661 (+) comp52721_c0_seq1:68-2050(+)
MENERKCKHCVFWVLLVVFGIVPMSIFLVLFEVNRFGGRCHGFRDSRGGFVAEHGELVYKCNIDSHVDGHNMTPETIDVVVGEQDGPLHVQRSYCMWVVSGLFYALVSAVCLSLIFYRAFFSDESSKSCARNSPCDPAESDAVPVAQNNKGASEETIKKHSPELFRVMILIYLCTLLGVAYKLLATASGLECDRHSAQMAYSFLGGLTYVLQSMNLMLEVRCNRFRPFWMRGAFAFLSAYNLLSWGIAIANTACLRENQMAFLLGREMWRVLRPVFRSTIVFLRILSATIYFHLFLLDHKDDVKSDGKQEEERVSLHLNKLGQMMADSMSEQVSVNPKELGQTDSMSKPGDQKGELVTVYKQSVHCVREKGSIVYYRRLITSDQRSVFNYLLCSTIPFLIFALGFPVWYGFLVASESEKSHGGDANDNTSYHLQISSLEPIPNIIMNSLSAVICLIFLLCLLSCKSFQDKPVSKLIWQRVIKSAEPLAVLLFALGAIVYLTASSIIYNANLATKRGIAMVWLSNGSAALNVLFQFFLIIFCKFMSLHDKLKINTETHPHLIKKNEKKRNAIVFFMGFEVLISFGLIIQGILEEEFNDSVHSWDLLHGLIPLLIDFRVHATILLFALMYDLYGKDRPSECLFPEGDRVQGNVEPSESCVQH